MRYNINPCDHSKEARDRKCPCTGLSFRSTLELEISEEDSRPGLA